MGARRERVLDSSVIRGDHESFREDNFCDAALV
jgi:hypothetical protein